MLLNCGVGEDSVKSPLDCKIKQSTLKEINPECSLGRTDAEAKAPILWPPDVKNWLTGKDPDAGKDWRQEKGMTEVEIAGWHHWLNGHEFEQAPGDGKGQGSLVCFLGVVVHGVAKNWTWLSDWTTTTKQDVSNPCFTDEERMMSSYICAHVKCHGAVTMGLMKYLM